MPEPITLNREFAHNPLRRRTGADGEPLHGEFEADNLRLQRVAAGWQLLVPMRAMGESVYQEFVAESAGGQWLPAGVYPSQIEAQRVAASLVGGTKVWRSGYRDLLGTVQAAIERRDIAEMELEQHIAPRGAAF